MQEQDRFYQHTPTEASDPLQRELDEAQRTIRLLRRQIEKEHARYNILAQSYAKTVTNLELSNRENFELERDRDVWKKRAEGVPVTEDRIALPLELTTVEISAIRKAMARLHHPDTGGDEARMQAWNAALDALER